MKAKDTGVAFNVPLTYKQGLEDGYADARNERVADTTMLAFTPLEYADGYGQGVAKWRQEDA